MKKHIPNFLTSCNILVGAYGCSVVAQAPTMAIYFVIIAAFFDFADGLSARLLNAQSEFGKQLDSLADLVSFGLLPAMAIFSFITKTDYPSYFMLIPLLVVPFSALRLARFNLSSSSNEFQGLPTPANALLLTAFLINAQDFVTPIFLIALSLASCFLLVSNIRMIALKFSSLTWKGNELKFILVLAVITEAIVLKWSVAPFIIPTYILISIIGFLIVKPVQAHR